ncbi:hypothetical protein [Streptomyces sp. NPDC049099]|uniref:hypothetical protein n=1 Tax=unclassified Streptomyces TaxID=2593676 RepID=UPI003443CBB9
MPQTSTAPPEAGNRDDRPPARWAHRVVIPLRAVSLAFTVDTVIQAVLAGQFVNGDVGLLSVHELNARVLTFMLVAATVLATVAWRARAARVWPAVLGAVLILLVVLEQLAGYQRALAVHIPLGVAITGGAAMLAVWAFTLTRPVRELKSLREGRR